MFWAGAVVGLGVVVFGLLGLLDHIPDTTNWALWFFGGLLIHDAIVVPTVAGVSKMRTMVARDGHLPLLFFRSEGMIAGPYTQLEKDLD